MKTYKEFHKKSLWLLIDQEDGRVILPDDNSWYFHSKKEAVGYAHYESGDRISSYELVEVKSNETIELSDRRKREGHGRRKYD